MPRVVVYHDQPIASALEGERDDLEVVAVNSVEEALDAISDADMFVTNPASWTDEYVQGLSEGDWVQATSAGYAAFAVDEFERKGVAFTNAGGNYGEPVADHAFALTLGLSRGIRQSVQDQLEDRWNRELGTSLIDLEGRTLTIVGMGDIGESAARRGLGFGMTVRGTKRNPASYEGVLSSDAIYPSDAVDELLPDTDVLILAVPLTDETHHLIDAEAFRALPSNAILVNVARGPVVDEDALSDALEAGEIAGAGLDVFETEPLPQTSPLWDRNDVIVTPHVGGRSKSFVSRFVDLFLENYDRRQRGEELVNRIV